MRSVVAAALTLAVAVGVVATGAAAVSVTDQTGRTVELAGPPRRLVSLVPSVTEILYALGQEDHLAGVTDFCDYPPAARAKPSVGGMVNPSLEALVALRPDLVVLTTAGNRDETFVQLQRLRIPAYVVNPTSLAQALDLVERLARLTGRPEAAAPVVESLRRRVREVTARVAARPRPRVLYVVWPEPLVVPGRNAIVSELIELAGGRSITAGSGEGYPRYSVEAAVAQAPEVILLARHATPKSPIAREQWARFVMLPAIRQGRLHDVDGNLLHRYGPRVVDGLETLARLLHPEAFPGAAKATR
jgi:iron complex transport system substrate-binding protein